MAVPAVNITIEKGTDFESVFTVSNPDGSSLNLNNFSSVSKIKKFPSSESSTAFSVGIVTARGQVILSMASTISSTLEDGRHYYDVVIINNSTGKKKKIIEGMALVTPSASV
jgi:hypothetical protein